jgi:hypothetical protein
MAICTKYVTLFDFFFEFHFSEPANCRRNIRTFCGRVTVMEIQTSGITLTTFGTRKQSFKELEIGDSTLTPSVVYFPFALFVGRIPTSFIFPSFFDTFVRHRNM